MSGFRKAKPEQAALKIGMYGPPGSGKTFTSLLLAEGLSELTGKRIAFIDTERGTDFYCQAVDQRAIHPGAFDFDALYTRSITEVLKEIRALPISEYGVVIIDSMTHIWESAIEAYGGSRTSAGTIPFHAWGRIKKPYKDIMSFLLSSPLHVIICGRQGTEYGENEDTGELKAIGKKMKAEGETPYEPHILIRMEQLRAKTNEVSKVVAYVEKDRTGILNGHSFVNPSFEHLGRPLLSLLGDTQAKVATSDETAAQDAEELAEQDKKRTKESDKIKKQFMAKFELATDIKDLKKLGKELTTQVKAKMTPADVAELREAYFQKESEITSTSDY